MASSPTDDFEIISATPSETTAPKSSANNKNEDEPPQISNLTSHTSPSAAQAQAHGHEHAATLDTTQLTTRLDLITKLLLLILFRHTWISFGYNGVRSVYLIGVVLVVGHLVLDYMSRHIRGRPLDGWKAVKAVLRQ